MSDHDSTPVDLFDAIYQLDDLADWVEAQDYAEEAVAIRAASALLKRYIREPRFEPVKPDAVTS